MQLNFNHTTNEYFKIFRNEDITYNTINSLCQIIKKENVPNYFIEIIIRRIKYNDEIKINERINYYVRIINAHIETCRFDENSLWNIFVLVENANIIKNAMKNIISKNLSIPDLNAYFGLYTKILMNLISGKRMIYKLGFYDFLDDGTKKKIKIETLINSLSNPDEELEKFKYDLIFLFSDIFNKDEIFTMISYLRKNRQYYPESLDYLLNKYEFTKEEIIMHIMTINRNLLFVINVDKKYDLQTLFNNDELLELLDYLSEYEKIDFIKILNKKNESMRTFIWNNREKVLAQFKSSPSNYENTSKIREYLYRYWFENNYHVTKGEIIQQLRFIKDKAPSIPGKNRKVSFMEIFRNIFTFDEVVKILESYSVPKMKINKILDLNSCSFNDLLIALDGLTSHECFEMIKLSAHINADYDTIIKLIKSVPLLRTNSNLDNHIDEYILRIKIVEYCELSKFDDMPKIMELINIFENPSHIKHILEMLSDKTDISKNILTDIVTTKFIFVEKYIDIPKYQDYYDELNEERFIDSCTNNHSGRFGYVIFKKSPKMRSGYLQKKISNEYQIIKDKIIDLVIRDIVSLKSQAREIKTSSFISTTVKEDSSCQMDNSDNMLTICCCDRKIIAYNCGHLICNDCGDKIMIDNGQKCPICIATNHI
jgi:hypothetical protein